MNNTLNNFEQNANDNQNDGPLYLPNTCTDEDAIRALSEALDELSEMRTCGILSELSLESWRRSAVNQLEKRKINAPGKLVDVAIRDLKYKKPETPNIQQFDQGIQDNLSCEQKTSNDHSNITEPEMWPEPVNGVELLDEINDILERYLVLPNEESRLAISLWIVFSYCYDYFEISPMLAINSPTKRCGKTTLLYVLQSLVNEPTPMSNISPAATFRIIEALHPTMLIDECETFINDRNNELRGVLNSGHTKQMAFCVRCVGEDHEPTQFSTWCPKVFALIGKLPDTLIDRSIRILIERRLKVEHVDKFRQKQFKSNSKIQKKIKRWVNDNIESLSTAALKVEVPSLQSDRDEDNWEPLITIADAVGGSYPELSRQAAIELCKRSDDEDNVNIDLLIDIKEYFTDNKTDRITTKALIEYLCKLDHRPWRDWKNGKVITPAGVGRLLRPFGIKSKNGRFGGQQHKGYFLDDLKLAFERYTFPQGGVLPAKNGIKVTSPELLGNSVNLKVTDPLEVTFRKSVESIDIIEENGICCTVTSNSGGEGQEKKCEPDRETFLF